MLFGYCAMFATLLVWASFFISLKFGVHSQLEPADIAITRFIIPSLILIPFVVKHLPSISAVPKRYKAGLIIGSGLPYLIVAGTAMQFAPVSHGSALIPGTLPMFVSAIAVLFYKQPLSNHRVLGLCAVLFGVILFLMSNIGDEYNWQQLNGHTLFLLGSLMWAVFTISARVSNLNAYACAGFVSISSLVLLSLAITCGWLESYLMKTPMTQWPWRDVMWQLMLQGIGAGLVASFTFLYAVKKIGAEASAALGSLTPALATLLAIPLLSEKPDIVTISALAFVTIGSIVASNVLMKKHHQDTYRPPQFSSSKRAP
ncbi:DMT family transporter [Vibrio rotiferianus]|uniref:DMT family transporter n=1 Tax=Vibrio rotiferianus TaxID=190895 RepID=UPI00406A7E14